MKLFKKQSVDNVENDFSIQFSEDKYSGLLVANAEVIVTVPEIEISESLYPFRRKQCLAIFAATHGKNVFYTVDATAAVPGASGAVNVEMITPGMGRAFFVGQQIHIITPDSDTYYGISFYAL